MRRLGTMLDCSRNAVPTVKSLEKWIDVTSKMGYNTLLLYMEDTYELENHPYFGYMRGRYTQSELRRVNDYAVSKGVELIPCIQTLAHLQSIERWPEYWGHFDCEDILCVGDEKNYELIDRMFSTISKCFTSKTIHIGMDEAHMLGKGRYYDKNGDVNGLDIMLYHLQRICEIGRKYGFSFLLWSDMFFKLASADNQYTAGAKFRAEITKQIPENVELVYWDYYTQEKMQYDAMFEAHERIKKGTWFAGGALSWAGFAPHNAYSMQTVRTALESCLENQIQDVFFTLWGDYGGECSKFSLLPTLFYASEIIRGNTDEVGIWENFQNQFGVSFEDFLLLDLPGTPNDMAGEICNAEKYMLYNDCFTGIMDAQIQGGEGDRFARCAQKLANLEKLPEWGYLFATQKHLCHVLALKAELGVRTRKAYGARDRGTILELLEDYRNVAARLKQFHAVYRRQWLEENKPHGFDVQDIRLGGLVARVESCAERLRQFADGTIDRIEELEEEQLNYFGIAPDNREPHTWVSNWAHIVTTNVV